MKDREENLTLFAPLTPRQYRVLEWFFKEVAKVVFLEVLAVALIPTSLNLSLRLPLWVLASGLVFALTFLFVAVMLAGMPQRE